MTEQEQDTILFYAFRYALGRMTYAVSDVAELLIKYKNILTPLHKERIIKEIDEAIERNSAGMSCDVKEWEQVKEVMVND